VVSWLFMRVERMYSLSMSKPMVGWKGVQPQSIGMTSFHKQISIIMSCVSEQNEWLVYVISFMNGWNHSLYYLQVYYIV
jgi:hypothetical protein